MVSSMCWRFLATRSNRAGHRARRDERSRERALGEVHQTLHLRGFEIRVGDELLLSHRLQRADPRLQQHRLQLRRLRPGLCVVDAAARGFRANHSRRPRATPRNRPLFPLPRLRRRARPLRRRGHPVDLIPLVQNLPGLFHEIHRSSLLQPETSNEIVVRPRGALRGVEVPRGPVRDAVVVDLRAPRPRRVRSRVPGSASRDPDEAVRVDVSVVLLPAAGRAVRVLRLRLFAAGIRGLFPRHICRGTVCHRSSKRRPRVPRRAAPESARPLCASPSVPGIFFVFFYLCAGFS
ncbi:uncharacterized protein MICPUCDRAFT_67817 [Micromonas pusilla CCMP1545]|uniref:Predicted protein n=1 Tax=Micromonas pusilla (strain CCMP1545) TaxID=564608 RepID=C1NA26_MICPC|nr:uncharacterized protein MICPUCDRAFT_67817 [Micromonas pusilla CCMP1545]EEH51170.1 predicted protein [Micromonas pusilla CCMP1545]|eukprot:XP_003064836.1 predicted protein [Micromonas pusilla CCMP1545]